MFCSVYCFQDCLLSYVPAPNITPEKKLNGGARLVVGLVLADILISLTALVVGILGLTGAIRGMPPAASYTLVGLSGTITLAWIIPGILTKGENFSVAKVALKAAISSNPVWKTSSP